VRLGLGPGLVTLNCKLDHLARQVSSSFDELANDLRDLPDMPAMKGFRIVYENWCRATHAPFWSQVWDIVEGRPTKHWAVSRHIPDRRRGMG
jgi:hypothetical protein